MRALLAPDIVRMWEAGRDQPPIERTPSLLSAADAARAREELAALPVSRRDFCLVELRRRAFGDTLQGFAECPHCAGQLDIQFDAAAIQTAGNEVPSFLELKSHGISVRFRLPTSADRMSAVAAGEIRRARETLLGCCVIEARIEG